MPKTKEEVAEYFCVYYRNQLANGYANLYKQSYDKYHRAHREERNAKSRARFAFKQESKRLMACLL